MELLEQVLMKLRVSKYKGVPKLFYFWNKTGTKLEQNQGVLITCG